MMSNEHGTCLDILVENHKHDPQEGTYDETNQFLGFPLVIFQV